MSDPVSGRLHHPPPAPQARALIALFTLLALANVPAAAPKLDALLPAGGKSGTTNAVKSVGSVSTWPVEVWCSQPDIKFTAGKKKYEYTVTIGDQVKPGPHLVRIFSKDGASKSTVFVVGARDEVLEKEPNGKIAEAEAVAKIPCVINGRLEKTGDTDFFKLPLKRGQTIHASVDGYSLGSLIDPFLHLYDPDGYEIAVASDTHNIDPFLTHTVDRDGTHFLQVFAIDHKASTDVSFSGNSGAVYRLTLTVDDDRHPGKPLTAKVKEAEEKPAKPQLLTPPTTLSGQLARPGERDVYRFPAKKGEQLLVRVDAHSLHYPLDPVMIVKRPDGRLLREVDDVKPTRDPEYLLKASVAGEHTVEIFDRFRRGGELMRYRLAIAPPRPELTAELNDEVFELKAGATAELKLTLKAKHGFQSALTADFSGLPAGVTAEDVEIKAKSKSATIKLNAAKDADAASGPFRISLQTKDAEKDSSAPPVQVVRSFITGDSRGDYLLNETTWFWLRVTPAPEEKKAKESAKAPEKKAKK